MKPIHHLLAACLATAVAQGDTLNLTGVASGTSRFNDHFADGFGQINLNPEGFYSISNPSILYGSGYDVFPSGANFTLGTLSYNGISGVGSESATITGLTGDWYLNVDPSFGVYSTRFSDVTGTAQFQNGVLAGLNLSSSVTFTYTSGPISGAAYAGAFNVNGGNWSLTADNVFDLPVRHEWNFTGTVTGVPEPGPLALAGVGVVALWLLRRFRR
ncbi:MAG: PEP-CTERM sorting domain-containing protein [Verrucomicrobiae bacterium]|nr:PEP-CTERM sorting domain-containing protein [Verrucomicrobiae bacterium]